MPTKIRSISEFPLALGLVMFFLINSGSLFAQTVIISYNDSNQINGDTISVCFNTTDTFESESTGFSNPTYSWSFTGANTASSSAASLSNQFTTAGIQSVLLVVSDTSNIDSSLLFVNVRDSIIPATIGSNQTICFNTAASALSISTIATGANNLFTYEWQSSTNGGSSWTNTGSFGLNYSPGVLTATTSYRVGVSNSLCSVTKFSNAITVSVRPSIVAGSVTTSDSVICFNTAAQLSLTQTSGGDSNYVYTWERFNTQSSSWVNATGSTNTSSYTSPNLVLDQQYRVRVNSGCLVEDTTEIRFIDVADQFVSGSIIGVDTICFNTTPSTLTAMSFSGGRLPYSFQWQRRTTGTTTWTNIGANDSTLQEASPLTTSQEYQVIVTSSDNCGSVTSDSLLMRVNPLPIPFGILGDDQVCANQSDAFYRVDSIILGQSFFWSCIDCNFIESNNRAETYISWTGKSSLLDSLFLKQTVLSTGCSRDSFLAIDVSSNSAPNKSTIIQKQNTNILICSDSSIQLNYQWGYDDIYGASTEVAGLVFRYANFPSPIDTSKNNYWVKTWFEFESGESCTTQTYFNAPNSIFVGLDTLILSLSSSPSIYPNPNSGSFRISTLNQSIRRVIVFDYIGRVVPFQMEQSNDGVSVTLGEDLLNGVYFLNIKYGEETSVIKIILAR